MRTHTRIILSLVMAAMLVPATAVHGTIWSFSQIQYPGAYETYAYDIDNNSNIVGYYYKDDPVDYFYHGFQKSGGYVSLDYPGHTDTFAYGINNAGSIVGAYADYDVNLNNYGFQKNGGYSALNYPSASDTTPSKLLDTGPVVGSVILVSGGGNSGFLYDPGTNTWSNFNYPGAAETLARGISASYIVGQYRNAQPVPNRFSFIYDGATFSTITMGVPGVLQDGAYDINASGRIVGYYEDATGLHGYLVDVGGGNFESVDAGLPGASNTKILGINDAGAIVGIYTVSGVTRGFLAIPVPAPPALVLTASGLLGLLGLGYRRFRK